MMVLEVNEKEEQMVSTAYTTQKGFYRGTRLEWLHHEAHDMSLMSHPMAESCLYKP